MQRFYLYLMMTKPSELLTLSYPVLSASGKTLRPSSLIGQMKKRFPAVPVPVSYTHLPVRALTAAERIRILERMLEDLKRETRDLGIVKEQNFHLTKMLNIFVSSAMGAGMVLYDEKRGFRQIMIREPSVFRAFDTFIRSMREHGEVYSREETAAIIRKYIDWLKQGGTVAGTS